MPSPSDRLRDLGLTLPQAPTPVAAYVPAVRTGNLLFISGQVPFRNGELLATGPVPSVVSIPEAQIAAGQCVLNGLAVAASQLGSIDNIKQVVRLGVFVLADQGFTQHPTVANGASELLQEIFGDAGKHARAAVGAPSLPLDCTVEVEMILEV